MVTVALIQPSNKFLTSPKMYFSLGLLYIAAVLEEHGHNVKIHDMREGGSLADIPEASFYGVTATTSYELEHAQEIGVYLANNRVGKTVIGGHHATLFPDSMTRIFNYVVVGYGEYAMLSIVEGKATQKIVHGSQPDINSLPYPARHLLSEDSIFSTVLYEGEHYGKGEKATTMITSRNCPYNCSFCLPKGTLILTSNLTWIPIEQATIGTKLIGVSQNKGKRTRLTETAVTHTFHRQAKILKIETEDGTLYSTEEHPWLTTHNRWRAAKKLKDTWYLRKVSQPQTILPPTDNYKKGYVAGATDGDGYLGHYTHPSENNRYLRHRFRLVGDTEMMDTTLQYLTDLGIYSYEANFQCKGWPNITKAIRADRKADIFAIEALLEPISDTEYKRGYLAGFYDAEGSCDGYSLRLHNTDETLLNKVKNYLTAFGFSSKTETFSSGACRSLRIIGGTSENIRFMALVQPKVVNKKHKILNVALHNRTKIVSITKLDGIVDVYNLETTSSNFIADGFVTHNCPQTYLRRVYKTVTQMRTPESVASEIKYLIDRYDCTHFRFVDDLFTMDKRRALKICELIAPLNVHFRTQTRADRIDRELCNALAKSGCEELGLGVESADDYVLKVMRKGMTVEQNRKAVTLIKESGMRAKTNFMVGLPKETWETIELNKQFFRDMQPDKYILNMFCPFPGCDVAEHPERYGVKILDRDWSKYYNFTESFIETDCASKKELDEHYSNLCAYLKSEEWRQ